jgi:DNA helicase-2/ATP-dependent DNA helicase PcrA
VFPHSRAIDEGEVEEERRLCYVAITRAMRDLYLTYARRRNAFSGASTPGLRSRFLDEIPKELTDEPERRQKVGAGWSPGRGRAMTSWASASAATESATEPAAVFRVGDDVIHAAFGDGVVTGVDAGGIVVVRFAGDPVERRLMADYAPIRKK